MKLLYVQSQISPHLQSLLHGSPTFFQQQRPKHPLSALHPHFVSCLHAWDTLGCVIHHGMKLFPCFFHPHSSGLGWLCIGIKDRAETNAALKTCCFNESCVWGKFSSCWSYWAKSCGLHLFNSYSVDAAWYIKQANLLMVFISLSITSTVGLLHSFTKFSVNCG